MQKVIIDTNVLVSALIQRGYPNFILYNCVVENFVGVCIPDELFEEYLQALSIKANHTFFLDVINNWLFYTHFNSFIINLRGVFPGSYYNIACKIFGSNILAPVLLSINVFRAHNFLVKNFKLVNILFVSEIITNIHSCSAITSLFASRTQLSGVFINTAKIQSEIYPQQTVPSTGSGTGEDA